MDPMISWISFHFFSFPVTNVIIRVPNRGQMTSIRYVLVEIKSSKICMNYLLKTEDLVKSSLGKTLEVLLEGPMVVNVLDIATVRDDATSLAGSFVLGTGELGEAPLVGDEELLAAGKLVLGTTEGLNDDSLVGVLGTDRDQGLADGDTGNGAVRLTEGASHTSLQTIGTSAGQHLVDTEDVERMDTDTHVEGILAAVLADVLVGSNTGSFEGLAGNLLNLVREEMDTERELVSSGLLATQVEDLDLGVRDTTAETRLRIRLVLAVTVAASRTTTHLK